MKFQSLGTFAAAALAEIEEELRGQVEFALGRQGMSGRRLAADDDAMAEHQAAPGGMVEKS